MAVKAAVKKAKEPRKLQPVEDKPITTETLFLCKEFKLLRISKTEDRVFRLKFMADSMLGQMVLNLSAYDDITDMEDCLDAIDHQSRGLVFNDMDKDKISLTDVVRKDKNTQNKEPKTFFVFYVRNKKGFGYTAKSNDIVNDDIPDISLNFEHLESFTKSEIQSYKGDPQLTLNLSGSDGDDDDEDLQ